MIVRSVCSPYLKLCICFVGFLFLFFIFDTKSLKIWSKHVKMLRFDRAMRWDILFVLISLYSLFFYIIGIVDNIKFGLKNSLTSNISLKGQNFYIGFHFWDLSKVARNDDHSKIVTSTSLFALVPQISYSIFRYSSSSTLLCES